MRRERCCDTRIEDSGQSTKTDADTARSLVEDISLLGAFRPPD